MSAGIAVPEGEVPVGHLALVASRRVAVTSKATANGLLQLIKAGECLTDHSAEPIMINHVISMVRALMQIGGAEVRPLPPPTPLGRMGLKRASAC